MSYLLQYKSTVASVMIGVLVAAIGIVLLTPRAEAVNPFGGAASQVIMCYNDVIWTKVGPPRGGRYIWAPGVTRTYEYGPPSHGGQWLLGLFGAPYFCIVSPLPLIIFPGLLMTMLGSSGGSASPGVGVLEPRDREWKWGYTTPEQYDKMEDLLRKDQAYCDQKGFTCDEGSKADDVRAEREQRFGPR